MCSTILTWRIHTWVKKISLNFLQSLLPVSIELARWLQNNHRSQVDAAVVVVRDAGQGAAVIPREEAEERIVRIAAIEAGIAAVEVEDYTGPPEWKIPRSRAGRT